MHFLCLIDDSECCKNKQTKTTVFLLFARLLWRLGCWTFLSSLSRQLDDFSERQLLADHYSSHQRDQGENLNETTFSARLLIWPGSWGGTDRCCSDAASETEKYSHVPLSYKYRGFYREVKGESEPAARPVRSSRATPRFTEGTLVSVSIPLQPFNNETNTLMWFFLFVFFYRMTFIWHYSHISMPELNILKSKIFTFALERFITCSSVHQAAQQREVTVTFTDTTSSIEI